MYNGFDWSERWTYLLMVADFRSASPFSDIVFSIPSYALFSVSLSHDILIKTLWNVFVNVNKYKGKSFCNALYIYAAIAFAQLLLAVIAGLASEVEIFTYCNGKPQFL